MKSLPQMVAEYYGISLEELHRIVVEGKPMYKKYHLRNGKIDF